MDAKLLEKKLLKSEKIKDLLKIKKNYSGDENCFNFLPAEIKEKFGIVDTSNVSSHQYDFYALKLIQKYQKGIILDCGAGKRNDYIHNVVNFEVVNYDSTDVLGVAEELPFKDESFDAVFSLNVLEHVKDPFRCAREISRVLKKGGELYCVVPFLSPYHDYPDHYYNMTSSGLKNLFQGNLQIVKQDVISSGLPIFALTWILNSWVEGLKDPEVKNKFMEMKVKELISPPTEYLNERFVKDLTLNKNFELGATTAIWARKAIKVCF